MGLVTDVRNVEDGTLIRLISYMIRVTGVQDTLGHVLQRDGLRKLRCHKWKR